MGTTNRSEGVHRSIVSSSFFEARSLSFGVDLIKMMSERLFYRTLELKIIV